jgi:hypothetical protein
MNNREPHHQTSFSTNFHVPSVNDVVQLINNEICVSCISFLYFQDFELKNAELRYWVIMNQFKIYPVLE